MFTPDRSGVDMFKKTGFTLLYVLDSWLSHREVEGDGGGVITADKAAKLPPAVLVAAVDAYL